MQFTRNILKVYRSATNVQIEAGATWYQSAHNLAFVIGRGDVWRGAGVIAAYSPLTPWWRNVELAITSCQTGVARTDTLSNSAKRAQRILDGEDTRDVIKSDKTRCFAENIALNGVSDNVTVDVHAFSIAHYRPIPSSQIVMGKGLYSTIADCYKRAAAIEKVSPTEMQAITWVVWRDRYPKKAAAMRSK